VHHQSLHLIQTELPVLETTYTSSVLTSYSNFLHSSFIGFTPFGLLTTNLL